MEWEKLCVSYLSSENKGTSSEHAKEDVEDDDEEEETDDGDDSEVFEVEEILEVCYGDPNEKESPELHFKVIEQSYIWSCSSMNFICPSIKMSIFFIFHEMVNELNVLGHFMLYMNGRFSFKMLE